MTEQDNGPDTLRVPASLEKAIDRSSETVESMREALTEFQADVFLGFAKIDEKTDRAIALHEQVTQQREQERLRNEQLDAKVDRMLALYEGIAAVIGRLDSERENDREQVRELRNDSVTLREDLDQVISKVTSQAHYGNGNGKNGHGGGL